VLTRIGLVRNISSGRPYTERDSNSPYPLFFLVFSLPNNRESSRRGLRSGRLYFSRNCRDPRVKTKLREQPLLEFCFFYKQIHWSCEAPLKTESALHRTCDRKFVVTKRRNRPELSDSLFEGRFELTTRLLSVSGRNPVRKAVRAVNSIDSKNFDHVILCTVPFDVIGALCCFLLCIYDLDTTLFCC